MKSFDGKYYNTDVMNTEQILRLVQSIPSKKAEPFKLWLAQVGKERIDEAYDPEITINRALDTYRKKGYSEEWINQRLKTIDVRKEFTDELKRVGVNKHRDFAVLTNMLTQVWSGYSVKEYKNLKGVEGAEKSVIKGGNIARIAKEQLERETGKKVISSQNAKEIRRLK
ncbi:MAG: hypothetical protein HFJ29_05750 [Clostridia bacterium]|nr:hypothetical protein [Clostridia bacterium]